MRRLLLAGLLVLLPWSAEANPACGQTLTGSWTLTGDLDCSVWLTHGVSMASFSSLDCQGFQIIGPDRGVPNGTVTGRYGIRIDEESHITVTNCRILGYERGVNIAQSSAVTITGGSAKKNTKYGYNIGIGSSAVLLDGVIAKTNGDEGIHLGGPFPGQNTIQSAIVTQNFQEGVYLHRANLVLLKDSLIEDNSTDPNASHPDLNLDESTDLIVQNTKIGNQVRVIAQPQESFSLCASSVPQGCQ